MQMLSHSINTYVLAALFVSTIFLWVGAFLFMRSRTSAYLKLTGLAMITVWFYVSGTLMFASADDIATAHFWSSWGWTTPLTVTLWFHAVCYLTDLHKKAPRSSTILIYAGYSSAFLLVGLSSFTDLIFTVAQTSGQTEDGGPGFFTPPGPLFPMLLIHTLLYLGLSFSLLAKMYVSASGLSPKRSRQNAYLALGSLIILAGASFIAIFIQYQLSWEVPESYIQPFLLLGIFLISIGSIGYEGSMEASGMARQFGYSSVGALVVITLICTVLFYTDATVLQTLVIIGLSIPAYAYHDTALNSAESLIYAGALTLTGLTGNPSGAFDQRTSPRNRLRLSDHDDAERRTQVELVIKNFRDDIFLSLSPLSDLEILRKIKLAGSQYGMLFSQDETDLLDMSERIGRLRKLIKDAAYHLKPHGLEDPGTEVFDDVWGAYAACLYYIEGGRVAEVEWRRKWRTTNIKAGEIIAKPLELRLLTWRKNESQGLHRKWKNKYFSDAVAGIAGYIVELEGSAGVVSDS